MQTLRTPEERFSELPGFDEELRYAQVPDGEAWAVGRTHPTIAGAGNLLQEDAGPELAAVVADFVRAEG